MNNVKENIKVMSFNLKWNDIDAKATNDFTVTINNPISNRILQLNDMLNGEKIDIIGVQEASPKWVEYFAKLDSNYTYKGFTTTNTHEGGFIIYKKDKFDLLENGMFWLAEGAPLEYKKAENANFDRICSWAIFKIKDTGRVFVFMDTHVDYVKESQPEQAIALHEQTSVLQELANSNYGAENDCPLILLGDFNAHGPTKLYDIITQNLKDARVCSEGTTVPHEYGTLGYHYYCKSEDDIPKNSYVMDFIFITENIAVKNYAMIYTSTNLCKYGSWISDHNAITAELVF